MLLFKRINASVVLGSSIIIGVATLVSFWFAFGKDEGQLGTGYFANLVADSFYIFRFPTHVVFWEQLNSSVILYFFGLFLNCLFYGLLIERLWFLMKVKR
jgi:hypothetical protein